MKILKSGMRLKSAVCDAEFMVIKAPSNEIEFCCGGWEVLGMDAERDFSSSPISSHDGDCLIGKRYVDINDTIEVLCTKTGRGLLSLSGAMLELKQAKVLPSSD